jgi:hypothetical protein
MRWLIEFVGICADSQGRPHRPSRRANDVSIQSFVPRGSSVDFQLTLDVADRSSDAWALANVWKGCAQSSGHPTDRTSHPPEDPPALAKAFLIVVGHLQAKLYGPGGGKKLIEIVREQQ